VDILAQSLDEMDAARLPAVLFHSIHSAKFEASEPHRFIARQTGLDVFLHLPLEMKAQFMVEFALNGGALEERSKTNCKSLSIALRSLCRA
jgi:hypothetical protein